MRFVFSIVGLLVTLTVLGQSRRIEALRNEILNSTSNTNLADLHVELADKLYSYDYEEGLTHAQKSLELATKEKYAQGIAQALTSIGTYYYYKGDNGKARDFYRKALVAVKDTQVENYPVRTYIRLSILYRQQAYFDSSRWYLDQVEKLLPEKEGSPLHAAWYASLGILQNHLANNDEALALLRKSLEIRKLLPDSSRLADTWRNLGNVYADISMYDSAEYCFDQATKALSSVKDPDLEMVINVSRGEVNYERGDLAKAIQNYNDALDQLKINTYRRYYAYLLYKIGELYENQGAYNTAYEYLFNALKEFEAINSRQDVARAYSQIGWCYNYQENYALAIENANQSLALAYEIGDSSSIAQNKNLIGYALLKSGKYKEALPNFEQALKMRRRTKHWWGVTYTLYNSALTYQALNQTDKAFQLLFESRELNKKIGNKSGLVFTSNELGLLYAKTNQYKDAELYLNEANKLAISMPLPSQLVTNYKNFIFLSESRKDHQKTIYYFKLYTSLRDSLSNELSSSRMAKADAMFQLQKKASEIQLKNQQNQLQQAQIDVQQNVIQWQQRVLVIVITGLALLTILIIVIYRLLQARSKAKDILRKQNMEITEQKEEIQAQSEELTESNDKLISLNNQLTEKNHEIEMQSEKILEANTSLEKRVDERTQQLNIAYNELETFFYKTSHDFRRPLTTYLGLVEVAKTSVHDKQALELFEKIRETTLGLDNMLIKLQSISNIDYENKVADVSFTDLINLCLSKFKPVIEAYSIKVKVDNQITTIKTNEHLCRVFMENILENSIQFRTPLNPSLQIMTTQNDRNFCVIIEDNGQGIPAAIQHRIFEMYFRGNDNSKGNGLGLYIAKRAIDKLGGNVTFMSRLHEGTSFKITIPIQQGI